jgi:AcrR family transcriptional regulator
MKAVDDSCHACYTLRMPSYSDEQWEELRRAYIEVAIELIVRGGWQALGIRAVGQAAGKTGTAVNRLFSEDSLRLALIEEAFTFILVALPSKRERNRDRAGFYTQLVGHLREDPRYAALMVQVAAQASLTSSAAAAVSAHVHEVREKVIRILAMDEPSLLHDTRHERRMAEARNIVSGYIRACWALVAAPEISAAELRATLMC